MIATVDIDINAANPGMPLKEFAAFTSSPSHLRLRNVPRRVGLWELTKIYVAVTMPDNATRSVEATHNGALWTATVAGCAASGTVRGGFQVIADGVDESGNSITGYVLGVGDVRILSRDSTVNVDGVTYPLKICEEMPDDPKIGYCYTIDGVLSWYDGTEWIPLGGGSGDMSHADFAELSNVPDLEPDDVGFPEICQVVNKVKNLLKPAVALFALALPFLTIAAEVEVNKLSNLKGASNVVTAVSFDGLVSASSLTNYATRAELDAGWWSEWTISPTAPSGKSIIIKFSEDHCNIWLGNSVDDWDRPPDAEVRYATGEEDSIRFSLGGISYTATRHRVAAPIPTKPEDIGAASTNDVQLTPVHSQTWTFSSQPSGEGHFYFLAWQDIYNGIWVLYDSDGVDGTEADYTNGPENATSVSFSNVGVTATRSIIGYTLGSQTNKVLSSTNAVAAVRAVADAATATNAAQSAALAAVAQSSTNYTDSAIDSADTSYRRFTALTNVNQSVQFVTLSASDTTLSIEPPATGETKDWIVYVLAATNTTLVLPPATWYMADTANTNAIPAGMTAFYFSQMATGIYLLGRQELEPVTIQGN